MKIIYEPHPVSPERKAELRAQGFKIIDAAFKPADYVEPDNGLQQEKEEQAETESPPAPTVRRGRPRKGS